MAPDTFDDLRRLTMFADNLVPHVLRIEGVLHYSPDLLASSAPSVTTAKVIPRTIPACW